MKNIIKLIVDDSEKEIRIDLFLSNKKKELSSHISSEFIDDIYSKGIKNGALGGKLLGAGAGGFLLFYVPINKREKFKFSFSKELKRSSSIMDSLPRALNTPARWASVAAEMVNPPSFVKVIS